MTLSDKVNVPWISEDIINARKHYSDHNVSQLPPKYTSKRMQQEVVAENIKVWFSERV